MSKKKKKHSKHLVQPSTDAYDTSNLNTYVYFLISSSPKHIFCVEFSKVYEMLQGLFGDDPIPEDEAIAAVCTLDLDAKSTLARMTYHHYLHRAKLEDVLKEPERITL